MDDSLDDQLRIAILRLGRRMRLERVNGDVTDAQLSVLFWLWRDGALGLGKLSELERVTPPSMNRTVNGLVEAGLVERTTSADDGRKVLISPTEKGIELARQTKQRRVAWFSEHLASLSAEDRAVLDVATPILRALADS